MQPANSALASQEAKLRSPGATRSTVRPVLVEAARAQRADVVVQPARGREVAGRGVVGLGVEPELGRGADRQDLRVRRRRADRVGRARVAGGHADHHAGRHGRVVELLGHVERGDVRERVRAERLVEHVHVVGLHRVVDRLEEARLGRVLVVAEDVESDQADARAPRPRCGCCTRPGRPARGSCCTLYTCAPWPAMVLASRNASSPLVGCARPVAAEVLVVDEGRRAVRRG